MSNDTEKIAAILVLVLLCICCMGCCLCFCFKARNDSRRNVRMFRRLLMGIISNHVYSVVPEHFSMHDLNLEPFFPKFMFGEDFSIKAELVCCICFEEFSSMSYVRRLPCCHVFHDQCIDEWFKRQSEPHCPLCKQNPFLVPEKAPAKQSPTQIPRPRKRGETVKQPNVLLAAETDESSRHSFSLP
ncbi:unnamed protein product [Blepharisma stoltei]|uniref:RING-type domain-containing protein n=1 Tax=Blepharisma stoltei TaxID=1481888 RepID=A0AAU9IWI6_9CILI|nr:unnamed protein product [Blepharisma stoltei]